MTLVKTFGEGLDLSAYEVPVYEKPGFHRVGE